MEECGHYARWKEDFALVAEIGCGFLRIGPPLHRTLLADGRHDWEYADLAFAELRRLQIVPIVDLCHFGVPDWIGDFQNPAFPALFAAYARAFAARFLGCSSIRRSTRCTSRRCSAPATAGGTSRWPPTAASSPR
ncbi:family 1 glycosylhydrolase [Paeniroseomonas aquatica]|uniref:family 1 glycosylhydrolase n=1 Tax=Paeniroseomonas aquatica TaxID=373043 RepID=UPI00360F0685